MNTDDAVAATNPYPRRTVDGLPLEASDHVLLEEIMSTPSATTNRTPRPTRSGRRRRWLAPVAAAAAVAAAVAGGVALQGNQSNPSGSAGTSTAGSVSATPGLDPGLPPTAENLHQVLLVRDGWSIKYMDASAWGGSIQWEKGADTLQMTWYKADYYDAYLADRRADGTESGARLLGQDGRAFDMGPVSQGLENAGPTDTPTQAGDSPGTLIYGEISGEGTTPQPDGIRVMTILPPVGDWFLEFDAFAGSEAEYANVMASLTRVERAAWLAGVDTERRRRTRRGRGVPPRSQPGRRDARGRQRHRRRPLAPAGHLPGSAWPSWFLCSVVGPSSTPPATTLH